MKIPTPVVLCMFLTMAALSAQTFEVSAFGGYPMIGGKALGSISESGAKDDDTKLKGELSYGGSVTLNSRGYYGHELGYVYSRARFQTTLRTTEGTSTVTTRKDPQIDIHQAYYSFLMYMMPAGEEWRPYIAAGMQAYQYGAPRIAEYTAGHSRNYGAHYGGGIKLKIAPRALLRLDFKHYIGGKPYKLTFEHAENDGGRIRQFEFTGGFAITF